MQEPRWLDRTLLEAIHADLIREHGGAPGLRDMGLINAALARPRHHWAYAKQPTLATIAASLGFGLIRNHGFIDGNKRLGLMAIYVFLWINGLELHVSEPEAAEVILAVAAGSISERRLATWIHANTIDAEV